MNDKQQHDEQVKDLADRLISTLTTTMKPEQADAIVRDVATEIYTDLLGIKGSIVPDCSMPNAIVHGGFGVNGKRAAILISSYKFKADEA